LPRLSVAVIWKSPSRPVTVFYPLILADIQMIVFRDFTVYSSASSLVRLLPGGAEGNVADFSSSAW